VNEGRGRCTYLVSPTPTKTTEEGRWCLTPKFIGAERAESSQDEVTHVGCFAARHALSHLKTK
jgi:hypothetical protein